MWRTDLGRGSLAPVWQRRRFWHSPAPHALLHTASVSLAAGTVSAEGAVDRAAVAFLLDHKVTIETSWNLLALYLCLAQHRILLVSGRHE